MHTENDWPQTTNLQFINPGKYTKKVMMHTSLEMMSDLPSVELAVCSKQLQQRRQILAWLNVDMSLQQVRDALTLQTKKTILDSHNSPAWLHAIIMNLKTSKIL